MGSWTIISMDPRYQRRNDMYGNIFIVDFYLKYNTSATLFRADQWKEMPTLQWGEVISMYRRDEGTYWEYVGDQYKRNPASPTFGNWTMRYVRAYDGVVYGDYGKADSVHLFDKNGGRLRRETFGKKNLPVQQKLNAVRSYLQSNGGVLRIPVRDVPAINKPKKGDHVLKERLLRFDCGLKGLGTRVRSYQYLLVDSEKPESQWVREFRLGTSSHRISKAGLRNVPVPDNVKVPKPQRNNEAKGFIL